MFFKKENKSYQEILNAHTARLQDSNSTFVTEAQKMKISGTVAFIASIDIHITQALMYVLHNSYTVEGGTSKEVIRKRVIGRLDTVLRELNLSKYEREFKKGFSKKD